MIHYPGYGVYERTCKSEVAYAGDTIPDDVLTQLAVEANLIPDPEKAKV